MTLKAFIVRNRVKATAEWSDSNPNMPDMPAGSSHWNVKLTMHGRQMTVQFSIGPVNRKEPTAEDVLDCLISDASLADESFEDWCSDLGVDTDSRRAERIYNAVQKQTKALKQFAGELYSELVNTER